MQEEVLQRPFQQPIGLEDVSDALDVIPHCDGYHLHHHELERLRFLALMHLQNKLQNGLHVLVTNNLCGQVFDHAEQESGAQQTFDFLIRVVNGGD